MIQWSLRVENILIEIFIFPTIQSSLLYLQRVTNYMGQSTSGRDLYITIEAGQTQSQELFDYKSSDNRIITSEVITTDSEIIQDGENITYRQQSRCEQSIYSIKVKEDCLELINSAVVERSLWRVLNQGEFHPLELGSLIKIGKIKLKFKEIVEEQKELTEKDFKSKSIYIQQHADVKSISGMSNISGEKQCRICFDNSHHKQNPLVCLCKCLGSVKYIHYSCLKDWINNKIQKRQHNNTLFFSYEQTKCELCQQYYQPEFTYEGRKYMLLNLDNAPNPPYAIFEEVDIDSESKRFSVFLVGLGEEGITIGRNSNSTIVMKEISVSRNHCQIIYKNRNLFIKDKGSKFGTLTKIFKEVQFNPREGLSLQYESKLIKIHQKGNMSCCCAQSDSFKLRLTQNPSERQSSQRDYVDF